MNSIILVGLCLLFVTVDAALFNDELIPQPTNCGDISETGDNYGTGVVTWKYTDQRNSQLRGLKNNSEPVFAPGSLNVTLYRSYEDSKGAEGPKYLFFNLTVSEPTSVSNLKGYEAILSYRSKLRFNERLNTHDWTVRWTREMPIHRGQKPNWTFKCVKQTENNVHNITIRVTSLPSGETSNNYVMAYVNYVNVGSDDWKLYSTVNNWTTLMIVTIYPQNLTLTVEFVSAPARLGFIAYTACVIPKLRSFSRNDTYKTRNESDVKLKFYSMKPYLYEVRLIACGAGVSCTCDDGNGGHSGCVVAAVITNVDLRQASAAVDSRPQSTSKGISSTPRMNNPATFQLTTGDFFIAPSSERHGDPVPRADAGAIQKGKQAWHLLPLLTSVSVIVALLLAERQ